MTYVTNFRRCLVNLMEKMKRRKGQEHCQSRKSASIHFLDIVVVVVDVADTDEAEAVFNLRDTASINKMSISHKAHIEGASNRIEAEVINNIHPKYFWTYRN